MNAVEKEEVAAVTAEATGVCPSVPPESKTTNGLRAISELLDDTCDHIMEKINGGDGLSGVPTGFHELDRMTSGLAPASLFILAGRPGAGKSMIALNIALEVAKTKSVAVFNLEMSNEQTCMRLISNVGEVNGQRMTEGVLSPEDWDRIEHAVTVLKGTGLYIDDNSASTVAHIKKECEKIDDLGLIVVDYLQLMRSEETGAHTAENRQQVIANISRTFKLLAKELNVPVLCLSQLSRNPEKRPDKRPLLSDLRDSGALEQDADVVILLYREGYYDHAAKNFHDVECNVAKNRNGETGVVNLWWEPQYARFRNYELPFSDEEEEAVPQETAVQTEMQDFQDDSSDKLSA